MFERVFHGFTTFQRALLVKVPFYPIFLPSAILVVLLGSEMMTPLANCSTLIHGSDDRVTLEETHQVSLVGALEHELDFSIQLGMSTSQSTNSYFSEGWQKTTNQFIPFHTVPRNLQKFQDPDPWRRTKLHGDVPYAWWCPS